MFLVHPQRLPVIGDLIPRFTVRVLPVLLSRMVSLVEALQALPEKFVGMSADALTKSWDS